MTDENLFAIYFSGIVGWTLHPGYLRDKESKDQIMSLTQCADLADKMVKITKARYASP